MPLEAGGRDDGRLDCRPECATTARLTCAAMALDEFSGDVALVTGGGRGIGASIARELAGAGMRVGVAALCRAGDDGLRALAEAGELRLGLDGVDRPEELLGVDAVADRSAPHHAGVQT
jgi:NAD(P)-dependent dehydrogenase (short-subunit alcohol dehydrogenase family)